MLLNLQCYIYFLLCIAFVSSKDNHAFEEDNFYDIGTFRSSKGCSLFRKLQCIFKCGFHKSLCYKGSCYCIVKQEYQKVNRSKKIKIPDNHAFEEDYFFDIGTFRSSKGCSLFRKLQCIIKCGFHKSLCYKGSCYCIVKQEYQKVNASKKIKIPDNHAFEEDYFFDIGTFRSSKGCSLFRKLLCVFKCGFHKSLCYKGSCYCIVNQEYQKVNRSKKIKIPEIVMTQAEKEASDVYLSRPALRHHIAHFCPNLDVARSCIIECMKTGRPAFCGKDHVCYCGHKYKGKGDSEYLDLAAIYAMFLDMYEKYFGPKPANVNIEDLSLISDDGKS